MKIFISHSSLDKEYAQALVEFVKKVFVLHSNEIRCTSIEGYTIDTGTDFNSKLRYEVEDSEVLIAIVSNNLVISAYSMFELGARWGLKKPLMPVTFLDEGINLMEDPFRTIQAKPLNCDKSVYRFVEDLSKYINKEPEKTSVYIDDVNNLVKLYKKKFKEPVGELKQDEKVSFKDWGEDFINGKE